MEWDFKQMYNKIDETQIQLTEEEAHAVFELIQRMREEKARAKRIEATTQEAREVIFKLAETAGNGQTKNIIRQIIRELPTN